MVMVREKWCDVCDITTMHHDNKCIFCTERKRRLERAEWMALTNEEKIEILLKRIEDLEASPTTY